MKRRKSLMIPALLLLGLFLVSGCGDGIPEGTLNTTGATLALTSDIPDAGLTAGNSCILTATLIDNTMDMSTTPPTPARKPLAGQEIAFTFSSNRTGGALYVFRPITNSGGQAYAIYTAGRNQPGLDIEDIVQANIKDLYMPVVLMRKGSGGGAAEYSIAVAQTPTGNVAVNASVTLTATVTNADGDSVANVTVNFNVIENKTGLSLTVWSGTTDANGVVTTIYTCGTGGAAGSQDIIEARVAGSTGAVGYVILTRS